MLYILVLYIAEVPFVVLHYFGYSYPTRRDYLIYNVYCTIPHNFFPAPSTILYYLIQYNTGNNIILK